MNFEKIALVLFLKYVQQFGDIKTHLTNALREMILAATTSMEVVQQTAKENKVSQQAPLLQTVLDKTDSFLQFALTKIPEKISEENVQDEVLFKQEIWESVILAIEEEIENISEKPTPSAKLQIEALETIRQALLKKADSDTQPPHSKTQSTTIKSKKAI